MATGTKTGRFATAGVLVQALREDDLDAALRAIMVPLGIKTGDVAGIVLGDVDFKKLDTYQRARALVRWLDTEMAIAAAEAERCA